MPKKFLDRLADKMPVSGFKMLLNIWPPFRGAGIKVEKVSPDYRQIEVHLKLKWWNKNYVGCHFGGSLYAMTDPFHMLPLIRNLGRDYIVWDKAGHIDYKKPGYGIVRAEFNITEEEIQHIREETNKLGKYIFDQTVNILNEKNEIVASVTKTLYVRRKKTDLPT